MCQRMAGIQIFPAQFEQFCRLENKNVGKILSRQNILIITTHFGDMTSWQVKQNTNEKKKTNSNDDGNDYDKKYSIKE